LTGAFRLCYTPCVCNECKSSYQANCDRRFGGAQKQDNKPQNEVVRELLEKALTAERPRSTGDALLRLVDLGKRLGVSGPKDWATRHDAYFAKEV
jgi:hypothetical protein